MIVKFFYNNGWLALESSTHGKLPFALFEAGIKLVRAKTRIDELKSNI